MKKLLLLLSIFPLLMFSQRKQPKVGLVLSGGGAKGFAHIGVLKELEKSGVQIDYIGGTSMGAIVGGLYASGYSAKQIEKIVIETDFYNILQDKTPRKSKPFFDKENSEKHAVSLPIRNGSIGLPQGVSKGQNVLNFLSELLAPVDDINDFTKLPIPFYCIATNVETGNQVLLEDGFLPLALRASGSFPTLLHPVEIKNQLLIDGGIANNFPVDIMKKKDVDIIIGVDVQGKLVDRKKLTSVVAILNQIVSYRMYEKSDLQKEYVNVYMHPDVVDYSVVSFDKGKEILKEGIEVAKPLIPIFDSIAKLQLRRDIRKPIVLNKKRFLVDRIVVNGNKNYTKNYILGTLKIKEGDSITYNELSKKINSLTATKNFQRIDYHFEKSFSGKKLTLKVKESNVRTNLRLGLHYDLLYRSAVLLNYSHKKMLLKNDELSLDVVVGDNIRYNLDYFVDNGFRWNYGMKSRYNSFRTSFSFKTNDINRIDIRYRDFTNTIYAQTTFDKKFALGLRGEYKNLYVITKTIKNNVDDFSVFDDSNYLNGVVYLKLDTYDKEYFPKKGFYSDINFKWYLWSDRNSGFQKLIDGSDEFNQFSQIKGTLGFATTFWDKLTFQYTSQAGFTLGEEASQVFDFRLGGYNKNYINNFFPFYGYTIGDLTGQSFLRSEFEFRYCFLDKHYASFIANYARTGSNVLKGANLFDDTKSGYALGYSLETFLGPIELKYSWSPDTSENYWLFNLGFWF
ncbi:patatin-like phospholipase family protein [Tenacibaculum sp.]|nr:patatin-like phospholipase family protein [Tenacibaculum sp.]